VVNRRLRTGGAIAILFLAGCAPKPVPTPPAPLPVKQNVFVLLPDPEGQPGGITVGNPAGTQSLDQSYQAVRVERPDVAPTAPFTMDQAEVGRLFGAALDVLPAPEVQFTLYFDEGRDVLTTESESRLPAIFDAVRDRHSTAVSVTGHTDTMGEPASNYQLGMRRAQGVADLLIARGLPASDVFVASHGEADLVVKTPRGVMEPRNRRVEVIVR
jgi:outer membrane protein OmpA-like peptidoglycan-associated protein